MKPSDPAEFELLIGKPRLQSYKSYFKTTNPLGLYMWNGELSKCCNVLMCYFELSLRNRMHVAMANHYLGHTGQSAHWWDGIASQLGVRTMDKVKAVRESKNLPIIPPPSADEIVSRVSFGFWTAVLSRIDLGQAHLIMPLIFPGHALNANPMDWKINSKRKLAISFVYEMNAFRNRLAHHEPLWKFSAMVVNTQAGSASVPASTDRQSSIARFQRLLGIYDDAMAAMSKSLHDDLRHSSWRRRLEFLLSRRGIKRYESGNYKADDSIISSYELHKNFAALFRRNAPVRVGRAARTGLFIPD